MGRRLRTRAFWVALVVLVLVLVVVGPAWAANDALTNVAPQAQATGLADQFALGNYALDSHFQAISVGLLSGVDASGVPPMIAYFLANTLWQLTAFLGNALITLFGFAFSLDLLNGSPQTGGAGALAPVSAAVRQIYASVFGAPWLTLAIAAAGVWAMWKALVQRRYTETAGALATSLAYVLIALAFVTHPQQTIGTASRWTNQMSVAFLSLTSHGTLSDQQQAKQTDINQLFKTLIFDPWVVLQFGGYQHCTTPSGASSLPVQPLAPTSAQNATLTTQLGQGLEVHTAGKTCVNNANKYAAHFLAYPPSDPDRTSEYQALKDANPGALPATDPARGAYRLSAVDKPAAEAMGKDGQYQRLLLAVVIFAGELGALVLLGVLSVSVILAQIIVLLLLAFAPVALVIAVFPGRGHDFFRGWLARLATFLVRKAIYSLILAVLLAITSALTSATQDLGWLMSFGLQAIFYWAVFLHRHQLTGQLLRATTGHAGREDHPLRLSHLYLAQRLLHRHHPPPHPAATSGHTSTPAPADPTPPEDPDQPDTDNQQQPTPSTPPPDDDSPPSPHASAHADAPPKAAAPQTHTSQGAEIHWLPDSPHDPATNPPPAPTQRSADEPPHSDERHPNADADRTGSLTTASSGSDAVVPDRQALGPSEVRDVLQADSGAPASMPPLEHEPAEVTSTIAAPVDALAPEQEQP